MRDPIIQISFKNKLFEVIRRNKKNKFVVSYLDPKKDSNSEEWQELCEYFKKENQRRIKQKFYRFNALIQLSVGMPYVRSIYISDYTYENAKQKAIKYFDKYLKEYPNITNITLDAYECTWENPDPYPERDYQYYLEALKTQKTTPITIS